ncbi:MAG: virulence protein RhuM/Fic/DOC family protein [Muribaculaceae bacterium]|nr:virulence protein RhuM/Fic/DOC family protein [Muribaculaceae bacterium]MDE6423558.1 virulence protein RhuM/Fic/DOC family protein [Muribaculaceae bacterium]
METNNETRLVIYKAPNGETQLDVTVHGDTIWLTQRQIAELFGTKVPAISKHLKNIFESGELERDTTISKMETVVNRGFRGSSLDVVDHYNLDAILSVGYRVNSKNATAFRIWANKILKQYLLQGYAINERIASQKYDELSQLVKVLGRTIQNQEKLTEDSRSLLDVVVDYTYALDTLDRYDYQELKIEDTTGSEAFHATYENAMEVIRELHEKFGGSTLFGNEKDDSFKSSIGQIYQTFGGVELYPSVEEKAAMLLYLVTKNHSFSDGNKRIAATLFLWFLNGNGILYNEDGSKRIADNTLVALTLMIAESRTEEKDTMVKVIVNLINKNN